MEKPPIPNSFTLSSDDDWKADFDREMKQIEAETDFELLGTFVVKPRKLQARWVPEVREDIEQVLKNQQALDYLKELLGRPDIKEALIEFSENLLKHGNHFDGEDDPGR